MSERGPARPRALRCSQDRAKRARAAAGPPPCTLILMLLMSGTTRKGGPVVAWRRRGWQAASHRHRAGIGPSIPAVAMRRAWPGPSPPCHHGLPSRAGEEPGQPGYRRNFRRSAAEVTADLARRGLTSGKKKRRRRPGQVHMGRTVVCTRVVYRARYTTLGTPLSIPVHRRAVTGSPGGRASSRGLTRRPGL